MEVNVLADLLRMTQDHKHYVMLDPVLQEPNTVKPSYQLYNKKKVTIFPCDNASLYILEQAIAAAADILQVGAKNLNSFLGVSNSDHFHKALLEMRKRWKLRRTNTGIVGDLNYPGTFNYHVRIPVFILLQGGLVICHQHLGWLKVTVTKVRLW